VNCINLPEFRVIKAEENEFDYRFTVETIEEPDFCPQCFYTTDSPRYDGKPFITILLKIMDEGKIFKIFPSNPH
jgi:hypothetical protein